MAAVRPPEVSLYNMQMIPETETWKSHGKVMEILGKNEKKYMYPTYPTLGGAPW
jgi:hypothetical protein